MIGRRANQPDAVDRAIAPRLHSESPWRGATDPERSMRTHGYACYLLLSLGLLLTACAQPKTPVVSRQAAMLSPVTTLPLQSESDAGILATNLARQMRLNLEEYDQPLAHFNADQRSWWFFYDLKPPGIPGGHFLIVVYADGRTRFSAGE